MALDFIPRYWHDSMGDTSGVGHNLYAIASNLNDAKIPRIIATPAAWNDLHKSVHAAVTTIAHGISLPKMKRLAPDPPPPPVTVRRRLQEVALTDNETAVRDAICAEYGVGCLDCQVITGSVDNVVKYVEATGKYYTDDFVKVCSAFIQTVAHWESINADPDVSIFGENINVAYTPRPSMTAQPEPQLALAQASALQEFDWAYIARQFVTVTDDTHIPIVEHSLWWYLKYPLKPCSAAKMIYESCNSPKYSVADAAALTLRIMLVIWAMGWLTALPLPFLLQLPLAVFLFGIFRYDYVPRCLPLAPLCLMRDIQYAFTAVTPPCLCQLVPELVVNINQCTPDTCAESTIVYRPCPTQELGMLWAPIYTVRWLAPSLFEYLSELLDGVASVDQMRADMDAAVPLSPVDLTCAKIGWFNIVNIVLLLKLAGVVAVAMLRPALQYFTGTVSTLSHTLPFLFVTLPKLLKKDEREHGTLLRGWQ
jgi:hypothetical protein